MWPVVELTFTGCSEVTAFAAPTGVTPLHSLLMIMACSSWTAVGYFTLPSVTTSFLGPSYTVTLTAGASTLTGDPTLGSTATVLLTPPTVEGSLALQSPA